MAGWDPSVIAGKTARRSGWGAPIALFLVATFSIATPGLLLLVPLALLLLAVPPRRPSLVLLGGLLLSLLLIGPQGDSLWWFTRGWALMLGALFLVGCVLRPQASFLDRALGAVFGTTACTAILLAVRSGWSTLDGNVAATLRQGATKAEEALGAKLAARAWGEQALQQMQRMADLQTLLFPALLALASLAALALVWWVWRKLTVREANPLSAFREFSFRDELVWLVVAAVLLMVLPLGQYASRAGTNLAAFMGTLYALRGLAIVLAVFGAPTPIGVFFGVLAMLLMAPILVASALVLGLSDTWLDLRSRMRQFMPPPTQ